MFKRALSFENLISPIPQFNFKAFREQQQKLEAEAAAKRPAPVPTACKDKLIAEVCYNIFCILAPLLPSSTPSSSASGASSPVRYCITIYFSMFCFLQLFSKVNDSSKVQAIIIFTKINFEI